MSSKKSLYEILEVAQDASYADIRAAYQRLVLALQGQQAFLSPDDYTIKQRALKTALDTLSTPMARDAYDAHLSARREAAKPAQAAELSLVPMEETVNNSAAEALKMRAEALALRAEAMSLRADAMSIKAGLPGAAMPASSAGALGAMLDTPAPVAGGLLAPFRTVLLALGTLVAIAMVLKLVFMFTGSRQPDDTAIRMQRQMEEKVYLQEYYQTHGVRPASRAEADLMDAERRSKAQQLRAQENASNEQARSAEAERQFQEDARRRAEQVSADLQYAEEKARQAQQEEDAMAQQRKEYEASNKAEAERRRIAMEEAKWQRVLDRPLRTN